MLRNNFKENIKEAFPIQYKFRRCSIDMIFQKEVLSTLLVSSVMILINITYLLNFNIHQYTPYQKNIVVLTNLTTNETYWDLYKDGKISPQQFNLTKHINKTFTNVSQVFPLIEQEENLLK